MEVVLGRGEGAEDGETAIWREAIQNGGVTWTELLVIEGYGCVVTIHTVGGGTGDVFDAVRVGAADGCRCSGGRVRTGKTDHVVYTLCRRRRVTVDCSCVTRGMLTVWRRGERGDRGWRGTAQLPR